MQLYFVVQPFLITCIMSFHFVHVISAHDFFYRVLLYCINNIHKFIVQYKISYIKHDQLNGMAQETKNPQNKHRK